MGYFNDLTLSYTAEDARLDARDGITPLPYTHIDPTIAEAAKYHEPAYSIYYSSGRGVWHKQHGGSFPSYKLADKALKRLGWQRGNGMYHCIIPATVSVLAQAIGLELLYGSRWHS